MTGTLLKLPKPCQCREWLGMVAPSRRVICISCGVARTTLSESVYRFISGTATHFGEPKEPVICRTRSTAP
jgi:hypothetical protein